MVVVYVMVYVADVTLLMINQIRDLWRMSPPVYLLRELGQYNSKLSLVI